MPDLPEDLRRLSRRGTERGADAVLAAATSDAQQPGSGAQTGRFRSRVRTSSTALTALAAAVLLVAGIAGAMVVDTDGNGTPSKRPSFASAATTSSAPTTTTSALPPAPSTPKIYLASTRLVPFDSCPTLASYAKQRALDTVGAYGLPYPGLHGGFATSAGGPAARTDANAAAGAPGGAVAPSSAASQTPSFSGTNVQEVGIDEPDLVKTDGKTIFAIANFSKVFATAVGESPRVLGSVEVRGARELFLTADKLVVISDGGAYATDARVAGPASSSIAAAPQPTRISVFDVSNPAAMKLTGSVDVEGGYISARLIDGVARIAMRSYPRLQFAYPTDPSPEAQAVALAHNRDVIRATKADAWLPHFTVRDAAGRTTLSEPLAGCANSYRPPSFSGFGMLSVLTLNTDIPTRSKATSVMADGQIVYASAKRMYVATNAWQEVQGDAIVNAPTTLVHAFDIDDPGIASYAGSGKVRGTVLNQFALSEFNGLLRVATTDETGGSESFVTVLQDNGEALVPIGQVGGLGHGERIFGVRFIDDAAYVVTFRQTDPLYVVDLGDPTKPVVKGELKVTGYSAYLHPIASGRLMGIGQDVASDGRTGLQASVFDVADPSNPKLLTRTVIGGSYSSAAYDHHAFLYWAPAKLAVVPINAYGTNPDDFFAGAIGMRVEDAGITEIGRMQPPREQPSGYPGIDRTIVIGDRLYALSSAGVLVNTLEFKSTAWVPYS